MTRISRYRTPRWVRLMVSSAVVSWMMWTLRPDARSVQFLWEIFLTASPCTIALLAIAIAGAGFLLYWRHFPRIADEVHDLGDALLIVRGHTRATIPLLDIERIAESSWPEHRITLVFTKPSPLGQEVSFRSNLGFHTLDRGLPDPLVEELNARVDRARQRGSATEGRPNASTTSGRLRTP